MRRLLTILLVSISLVSFGQSNLSNAKVKRVAHVDSVFHENLPIGSLIINSDNAVADGGVYRVKASNGVASTRSITTALANSEINEISGLTGDQLAKLNGIEAGAEVNVQADLTETNSAFDSYVIGSDTLFWPHDTLSSGKLATKHNLTNYYTKTESDATYPIDSIWKIGLKTYYRQGGVLDSVRDVNSELSIGDYFQGGLIFQLSEDGLSGLIVTDQDLGSYNTNWSLTNTTTGATNTAIGTGLSNTQLIVSDQGSGDYAANNCYAMVWDGYSDWYLPSRDELVLIYDSIVNNGFGDYSTLYHLSSTESSSTQCYVVSFSTGAVASAWSKTGPGGYADYVAIRSFSIGSSGTLPTSPSSGDMVYFDGSSWSSVGIGTEGQVLKTTSGLPAWGASSGTGTVTSFSAGNLSPLFTTSVANATSTPALTFSLTAATTYRVFGTAGTTTPSYIALTDNHIPDNITASNYLPLSGAGTLTGGKLITAATTSSYASVNLPHGTAPSTPSNGDLWTTTSGVFARVNGVTIDLSSSGGGGVNSVTFPSTGGLYNSGTSTDINGILDFSNLNDAAIATGDYIAFTDISSGTSPLAVRRETVSDLKVLVSPTVKEADGSPSYTNIETIEFDGAVVSQPSAGVARVTISESGGGGGDESFQTLTSSSSISWNFTTSKNANLTIGTNATLTISNQANGEDGELWVYPNASTDYTLTFPSYYFANDHSNVFTIEAGSGTIYRFTLKYNGTHKTVDYATYTN